MVNSLDIADLEQIRDLAVKFIVEHGASPSDAVKVAHRALLKARGASKWILKQV